MVLLYWSGRTLGIIDYLRRRVARFKLGAHLLDLRCLLFKLGAQELNFIPLLCANGLEIVR